jgi:regulator of sigma E protease
MSVLIFLLVLFVLVLVHEWGHFIVAKKTGMRVDEFGIGFPPKLFGIKKGETEYTFNALPIGGFVKIWGENGEEPFSPVESKASDRRSEASAEAGEGGTKVVGLATSAEAGEGGTKVVDYSRSFSSRPKWAQALVLIAGVVMNILFAWFLFSLTYMIGVQTVVEETAATEEAELYITSVMPGSPAAVIPAGSIVTGISFGNENLVTLTPSGFSEAIQRAEGGEVTIDYVISGDAESVIITAEQGLSEENPDRYLVGASLAMVEVVNQPFFSAIAEGFNSTISGLKAITVGLYTLISQAFVGDADFSQVAGPVGIVGLVGEAATFGITALLTFTAIISLNLAVINMLPFPALDGGRLLFVAIEAVTQKTIPPEWAGRLNLVGFAILMLLMIAVTYNDILRLL